MIPSPAVELVEYLCDVIGFGGAAGGLACHAVLAGFEEWRSESDGKGGEEGESCCC